MNRTDAQKIAAKRDGRWCLWCLYNYTLSPLTDVHHIFGRARSDEPETCIGLCTKCHREHHEGRSPYTHELLMLMSEMYCYDYSEYAQFIRGGGLQGNS